MKKIALVGGDPRKDLPIFMRDGLEAGLQIGWMVPRGIVPPVAGPPSDLGGILLLPDSTPRERVFARAWADQAHVKLRDPSTPFRLESFGADKAPPANPGTWVWDGTDWTWWDLVMFRAADSVATVLVTALGIGVLAAAKAYAERA